MILYFSGCGNSADVATRLGKCLGDTDVRALRGDVLRRPVFADHTPDIVWVMPVYSWGVPPVVVDLIKQATFADAANTSHHLVLTCGDDAGLAHRQWQRLMHRRGLRTVSAHTVIMPNTYTLMKGFDVDSPQLTQQKLEASVARVEEVARHIASGEAIIDVTTGKWPWVKSRIVYPWFTRFAMSPKPLHHTDACIGCGKCSRRCPMGNITMINRRPVWGKNCALCLGCYNVCPTHAVQYGRATADKGQYINPDTTE